MDYNKLPIVLSDQDYKKLTDLIAQIVPGHATSHEDGGADELDVTGLSGVLADAQTPAVHLIGSSAHSADTLVNFNTKLSDATIPHDMEGSQSISEQFLITNAEFGADAAGIINRGTTLTRADLNTDLAGQDDITAIDNYLYAGDSSDARVYKINRNTGITVDSVVVGVPFRGMAVIDKYIAKFASSVYLLNTESMVVTTQSFSSGSINATSACANSNGDIIAANDGIAKVYSITHSSLLDFDYTDITPSGLTNVKNIICNDTHYYLIEYVNPTYYVRKYDIATSTLQASLAVGNSVRKIFDFSGGYIYLYTANTSYILDTSLNVIFSGSYVMNDAIGTVVDGVVYVIDLVSHNISSYQAPSLTTKVSSYFDASDHVSSDIRCPEISGSWSFQDLIRAHQKTFAERYNNYLDFHRSGWFTVPSGIVAGSFDIEIPNVLGVEIVNTKADISLFVDKEYTLDSFEAAQSQHTGVRSYVASSMLAATWDDTLQPHSIPWLTTIEQQDTGDSSLSYKVSWDTTSRASDQIVRYHVHVRGPVWPLEYNPS